MSGKENSDFDNDTLEAVWKAIKSTVEDGDTYNYELKEKFVDGEFSSDSEKFPSSSSVFNRALTDVRRWKEAEGVIEVERRRGQSSQPRKVWKHNSEVSGQ